MSYRDELARRYGWPLKIHARGCDAYLADITRLLSKTVADLGKEVNDAAARIVEVADQPESAAFRNAVKDHRAAKADLSHWTEVLTRVNTAKGRA